MIKRKNKDFLFNIIRIFLPLFVLIFLLFFVLNSLSKSQFNVNEVSNKQSEYNTNNYNDKACVIINSSNFCNIPEDIKNLISNADNIYKEENKKGIIIEKNLSVTNATNEYKNIYIRNSTSNDIDIEKILKEKISFTFEKDTPQILIYHTHINDTYELLPSGYYTNVRSNRSEMQNENMYRIGEEIAVKLRECGFNVLHDNTSYDKSYMGAYDRARENISRILLDNPSIQVAIDIQRGAIMLKDGTKIKPTIKVNDDNVAQMKIICGTYNNKGFSNWQQNLSFALKLQNKIIERNENIMCPIYICDNSYNMDLIKGALQIEIGTDANTLLESIYSARILAENLNFLLKELLNE